MTTLWARSGLHRLLGASRHALAARASGGCASKFGPKFPALDPNTSFSSPGLAHSGTPSNRRPFVSQQFLSGWQSGRSFCNSFGSARMLSSTAARRQRDHYQVLGIDRKATLEQVKAAYRKKAMQHHPDRAEGCKKKAEEEFKEISEAHTVLSDAQNRRRYDMHGTGFEDHFDFAGMHARNSRGRPWEEFRGFDVRVEYEENEMTQEEAEEIFAMFMGRGGLGMWGNAGHQKKKRKKPQYSAKGPQKKGKSHGQKVDLDDILGHGPVFGNINDMFFEAFASMDGGSTRTRSSPKQGKKRRKAKAKTAARRANTSFVT